MLNTNQSKKRNSWEYYAVVTVIATFVLFLFQMEVIAKERSQIVNENESNIKSIDVYKIRKNTTDTELSEIKTKLQKNHNVKFETSDIKRNTSNQLTSIIVDIKKGKQRAKSIQNSDNQTINEFGVIVITYNNGDKKIGIQTIDESQGKNPKAAISTKLNTEGNVNTYSITSTKTDTDTNSNVTSIVTINNDKDAATTVTTDGGSKIAISNTAKTKTKPGNQLIIVDGEEMPSNFDYESINAKDIESVSIFKGKEAIAKYGDKGTNGVIEIETRK